MRTLALVLLAAAQLSGADFRVGRAAVGITPPVGMPMGGSYRVRISQATHDELHAKALVLEKDGVKAALIACDLVNMPRHIVDEARRQIEQTAGIRGAHVMISATHAHTGPEMGSRLAGVDETTRKLAEDYYRALPGKIAEAVRLADAGLAATRVRAAIGHEASLSFIRRFRMKDGSVGWNPGKLNPKILRPLGEIDPDVPVVYFDTPDAKALAAYVNFACHLDTVGGLEFSADYPYTLARALAAAKGPDLLTLFTIGTAGNINHVNVNTAERQGGHGEAARIGTILAAAVLKALPRLESLETASLRVRSEIVKLATVQIQPGEVEKARAVIARYGRPDVAPFLEQVHAFKVLDIAAREGRPIEAEVQVIALGDQLAWVGLPGEVFVELGRAIKVASPFRYTIIAELANGSLGYIPNRKAYQEGAYEVVSTRLAAGGGEALVDSAIRLLLEANHIP